MKTIREANEKTYNLSKLGQKRANDTGGQKRVEKLFQKNNTPPLSKNENERKAAKEGLFERMGGRMSEEGTLGAVEEKICKQNKNTICQKWGRKTDEKIILTIKTLF